MKQNDPASRDEQSGERPARKAYTKPRLEVYGDLTRISRTVATGSKNDGATHPNKHFTN